MPKDGTDWEARAKQAELELERERAHIAGYKQAIDDANRRAIEACEVLLAPILRRLS